MGSIPWEGRNGLAEVDALAGLSTHTERTRQSLQAGRKSAHWSWRDSISVKYSKPTILILSIGNTTSSCLRGSTGTEELPSDFSQAERQRHFPGAG
jgi:hypothetical protein